MSASFTPGPWHLHCRDVSPTGRRDDGIRFIDVETSVDGRYRGKVASVHDGRNIGGITLDERDANARLIAVAPEMFEYIASSASGGCATAQALILKATGGPA